MKSVYLIARSDLTPDHLRGGTTQDNCYVSRRPGRTNMSHEERIDGWLGQTNDWSSTACGKFDDYDTLMAAIQALGFEKFNDADNSLRDWVDDDAEDDFEIGPEFADTLVISGEAGTITLPPSKYGGYDMDGDYDVPANGWQTFAWYGDPEGWNPCPEPISDEHVVWDIDDVAAVLDEADVRFSRLGHTQGTTSADAWSFDGIYVRDEDIAKADAALTHHIACRDWQCSECPSTDCGGDPAREFCAACEHVLNA